MKKFFLFLFVIISIVMTVDSAYSFTKTVQIVVKGIVLDEYTGAPVETTIEFRTEKGKRFKIKSNSIDGRFEQVFNAGDKLTIVFDNWDIARKTDFLQVKDTIAYTEQEVAYTVRKLAVGAPFFKFNVFEPGTSQLKSNAGDMLDSLEMVLRFSRNIKVELRVNTHDSYAKIKTFVMPDPPKKSKKKKKRKKPEPEPQPRLVIKSPDMSKIQNLVAQRVDVIEQQIADWKRYIKRMKVAGDVSVLEENEGSNLDLNYDLEVIVVELKNPFD